MVLHSPEKKETSCVTQICESEKCKIAEIRDEKTLHQTSSTSARDENYINP